jgi:hypothetical protein
MGIAIRIAAGHIDSGVQPFVADSSKAAPKRPPDSVDCKSLFTMPLGLMTGPERGMPA